MLRYASTQFWHPEMLLLLHDARQRCSHCQLHKQPPNLAKELAYVPPADPFARWGIDFVGPLHDKSHTCFAIDYCTSWAIMSAPAAGPTSQVAASVLSIILHTFGRPAEIIAESAKALLHGEFDNLLRVWGVARLDTAPYNPRTNGKIERFNRTIKDIAKGVFLIHPDAPALTVYTQALAICSHRPLEHGFTPFYLAFGTQNTP